MSIQSFGAQRRKVVRFTHDFLLAAIACLAALGLAEVALHLCGVRLDASLFQMDPVRGYSFRPGASGWHTAENDIFVRISDQGNRDRLRSPEPFPGTFRIAVLGSSTTAGLEVEQQQTYTAQLEHDLSRPGAPVEVLNFAVEGYGPAQDFYTLQNEVWRFHPQIVMDEISLKQYVLNSTKKYSTTAVPYPYFRREGTGVVPDEVTSRIRRPTTQEIDRSNRMRSAVNCLDLILLTTEVQKQLVSKLKRLFSLRSAAAANVADPRDDPWRWTLVPPTQPAIEESWKVLEGLTLAMRDQANAHGAEFWVIVSDDAFQVNPDPTVAETLRKQMKAENLDYGDRRFDNFLTAKRVRHIHLEPGLLAYVRQTGAYLHGGPKMSPGEGHWNALGHQVVARIVAVDLERESIQLNRWKAAPAVDQISHTEIGTTAGK